MRYLFLIFFLPVNIRIYCQELSCKHITVKEGLPGSVVYHVLQDKNGFIWFATNQGVSRYDGKIFTNFTKEDGLPDNEILKLYLDKYNNIWFISFMGIPSVFTNGIIKRFDNCKRVNTICEDRLSDSIILISDYRYLEDTVRTFYRSANIDGKWRFTEFTKKGPSDSLSYGVRLLKASSKEKVNFYFSLEDKDNYALYVREQKGSKRYFLKVDPVTAPLFPFANINFFSITKDQKAIVFASRKTFFFAGSEKMKAIASLQQLHLDFQYITSVFSENDSILWICTKNNGLLCIKNYLTPHFTVQRFFYNKFCTSIIKDQEKGYWVTTYGDGVYYIPNLDFYTLFSRRQITDQNALCIRNFGKGQLCIGFSNGNIIKINGSDLNIKQFACLAGTNNHITDVHSFRDTNLLVASDDGFFLVSGQKKRNLSYMGAVKAIFISDSSIFVACHIAIEQFDRAANLKKLPFRKRCTCVTGINDIVYWGTPQGAYCYVNGNVQFLGYKHPLLSGFINHLDIAPDSSLWVSTQQGMVVMKNETILSIKKEQGLLSNNCKQVSFEKNTAWIATNEGISRIDYNCAQNRITYSISNITEEDGLNSNDVNQVAAAGDYIWAATVAGVCWFSKGYTSHSALSPLININRIVRGNNTLPVKDTIATKNVQGKLLIELSGISFRSGKRMRYEYRLKELDTSWSSTSNNVIEFSALPFGHFTFEVRAVDRWGLKSGSPKRIIFLNDPPFWKANWFVLFSNSILAILLSLGFYIYYRRRHQKREQEYQLKKKVQDLELMALRAQMNPHFIFNCLTSIQYHILRTDVENANNYLHKFSTLIRKTLQLSATSTISLREEIKILELYLELEKLRLKDRLNYQLKVHDGLDLDDMFIPTMIVQPYIENAIKHGIAPLRDYKGVLTLEIRKSGEYIEFMIEDNGPGIHHAPHNRMPYDYDYTSMGTSITGKRINAINAVQKNQISCRVIDKLQLGQTNSGTIVYLLFPLKP